MQRRRLLGLAAAVLTTALGLSSLSGCGSSAGSGDVTLHVIATDYSSLKTSNDSKEYWNSLARTFEQSNPHIKVDVQLISVVSVEKELGAMVKAGRAPDIAQTPSFGAYAGGDQLYSADQLFPVSMQSNFIPSLVTAGSINLTQYGIPWVATTRMMFYNKRLFAQAGITHPPKTWADLKRDAIKLKAAGVKVPFGLPLGPQEAQAETMMWLLGAQGGYTDNVGGYTFNQASNVETFDWVKKNLVDAGLVGPMDPAKTNVSDVFGEFLGGQVGMLNGHMALLPAAMAAHVDIGMVPLPGRDAPSTQALGQSDWVMAFKQRGHRDADAKFLQFLYGEKNQLAFQEKYHLLPVTVTVAQAVRMNPKDRALWPFLGLLPDAGFFPVGKASWGTVSDRLAKTIGQAVHGDPKTVLTQLQQYAQAQDAATSSTPSPKD